MTDVSARRRSPVKHSSEEIELVTRVILGLEANPERVTPNAVAQPISKVPSDGVSLEKWSRTLKCCYARVKDDGSTMGACVCRWLFFLFFFIY